MAKSETPENQESENLDPTKKSTRTPTRAEKVAARKRPLIVNDRAELKKLQTEARNKARQGMAAGDDKYLPARERGPQKRFARDYIDARFSIGELLMPVMVLIILASLWQNELITFYSFIVLWAFIFAAVGDAFFAAKKVQKQAEAKWREDTQKLRWYAGMRCIQMRFMRMPKPQVKRGEYPNL